MKVIVINKTESVIYNGIIYKCDDTFEADDKIAKSLIERGYVKEVTYPEPLPESDSMDEATLQTGYLDKEQLEEMSYPELKRLASQMGLSANGKKDDLIARICSTEVGTDAEAEAVIEEETSVEETDGDLPNTSMPE